MEMLFTEPVITASSARNRLKLTTRPPNRMLTGFSGKE